MLKKTISLVASAAKKAKSATKTVLNLLVPASKFLLKKKVRYVTISLLMILTVKLSSEAYKHYIRFRMASNTRLVIIPQKGSGTGAYVSTKRGPLLLTAAHVCEGSKKFDIYDENKKYKGELVLMSKEADLCLIKTDEKVLMPLSVAKNTYIGDTMYTMGYPLGSPRSFNSGEFTAAREITMNVGVVCANNDVKVNAGEESEEKGCKELFAEYMTPSQCKSRKTRKIERGTINVFIFQIDTLVCVERETLNHTTLPAWPGSSGSAVVDVYGNVVGVLVVGDTRLNWGALVRPDDINRFLETELK